MMLAASQAAVLDFLQFDLVGTDTGVQLSYLVAADDWTAIVQARAEGLPTSVSVTLANGSLRYSAVVPLSASARTVDLTLRPWPTATRAVVAVREGAYTEVRIGDRTAELVEVALRGGVEGVDPANPPLSMDPREPRPQPVTALPPVPTDPPAPQDADPSGPATAVSTADEGDVIEACRQSFAALDDQGSCIARLVGRPHAIAELNACRSLHRVRYQRACIEHLDRLPHDAHLVLEACAAGLGDTGDALNCMLVAPKLEGDVLQAIQACSSHIPDAGDALGCVKRASRLDYDVGPLLQACAVGFPDDPLGCMARASRSEYERSKLVTACTTAFPRGPRDRCLALLTEARGPDAAGVVRACTSLYDGDLELECIDRGRTVPSEKRIRTCGELRSRRDQLDCIGG